MLVLFSVFSSAGVFGFLVFLFVFLPLLLGFSAPVLLPCLCPFASSVLFGFPLFSVMFLFWGCCSVLRCVIFQCLRSSFFSACSPLATAALLGFCRRFGSLCPRLLMIITAWELVSCKDADANSPATAGLLAGRLWPGFQ